LDGGGFGVRSCKACGVRREDDEFYTRVDNKGRTITAARCKPCVREDTKRRRAGVPQKQTEYTPFERYRANQRGRFNRMGITACQYTRMRIEQDERCAICREPFEMGGKTPPIDHCHTTGRVRGLLCTPCNVGIGGLRDNPEWLRAAAEYVERH
jgi:hypothetical protein